MASKVPGSLTVQDGGSVVANRFPPVSASSATGRINRIDDDQPVALRAWGSSTWGRARSARIGTPGTTTATLLIGAGDAGDPRILGRCRQSWRAPKCNEHVNSIVTIDGVGRAGNSFNALIRIRPSRRLPRAELDRTINVINGGNLIVTGVWPRPRQYAGNQMADPVSIGGTSTINVTGPSPPWSSTAIRATSLSAATAATRRAQHHRRRPGLRRWRQRADVRERGALGRTHGT